MKYRLIFLLPAMGLLAGGLTAWQLPSAKPVPTDLPKPFATPSAKNFPTVVAKPDGAQLHVPPGFQVSVWADGFKSPRFLLQGHVDEILMSDSGTTAQAKTADSRETDGAVYVFPNANPAKKKLLISGLNRPYGLVLWQNYIYVAEADSVKRYPYDHDKWVAGKGQEMISFKGFNQDHWTRSMVLNPQGTKLYVGVGSGANVETGEDPRRAAINIYNPDGTGHEIFASGTRNPIGLHTYPNSNVLWAAVQERDELGDNLVPDYFTHIQQGGFYGWPYSYIGKNLDPRIKDQNPDLVSKAIVPDVLLPSHVAVLDFTFYSGAKFPAQYRGGAFLALHGSWNRSQRVGYEVAFVPFSHGKPSGPPQDFLTGFAVSPTSKNVWGRPVSVFEMWDGSLLVTDDAGGKIWRISYAGSGSAPAKGAATTKPGPGRKG